jgi:hypothetical protein
MKRRCVEDVLEAAAARDRCVDGDRGAGWYVLSAAGRKIERDGA